MDIYDDFQRMLERQDPQHGLTFNGVMSAADWIVTLGKAASAELALEISNRIGAMTEKRKLEVILVAREAMNDDLLSIVERIYRDGTDIHGSKVIDHARNLVCSQK